MRVSVAGTEVLANPDPNGPPVLLHPRHVARLAGAGGNSDPVLRQIELLKLPTHSAWGYDNLLAPADAEKVVAVLLAQAERAHRDFVDRLAFEQFKRDELARRQREVHEAFLAKVAAANTELERLNIERRGPQPPAPPGPAEKEFERFLRQRDKQEAQS